MLKACKHTAWGKPQAVISIRKHAEGEPPRQKSSLYAIDSGIVIPTMGGDRDEGIEGAMCAATHRR